MTRENRKGGESRLDLTEKLRGAIPQMKNPEPQHDLWPRMLRRIADVPVPAVWALRLPWFDWALLAVAGAAMVFFPALIPALLYHL